MTTFSVNVRKVIFRSDFKHTIDDRYSRRDAITFLGTSLEGEPLDFIKGIGITNLKFVCNQTQFHFKGIPNTTVDCTFSEDFATLKRKKPSLSPFHMFLGCHSTITLSLMG